VAQLPRSICQTTRTLLCNKMVQPGSSCALSTNDMMLT